MTPSSHEMDHTQFRPDVTSHMGPYESKIAAHQVVEMAFKSNLTIRIRQDSQDSSSKKRKRWRKINPTKLKDEAMRSDIERSLTDSHTDLVIIEEYHPPTFSYPDKKKQALFTSSSPHGHQRPV